MFDCALKSRHDFGNPVSEVEFLPENNEQNRILSFEEQRRKYCFANARRRSVAHPRDGMRPEELYRICAENVAIDQSNLAITFGKTNPHRRDKDKPMLKVNNAYSRALKKSEVRTFSLYDLRHMGDSGCRSGYGYANACRASRSFEAEYGHAHPQERHQANAMRRLEAFNAAKEIAEVEKAQNRQDGATLERVPHKFPHRNRKSRRFFKGRNRR